MNYKYLYIVCYFTKVCVATEDELGYDSPSNNTNTKISPKDHIKLKDTIPNLSGIDGLHLNTTGVIVINTGTIGDTGLTGINMSPKGKDTSLNETDTGSTEIDSFVSGESFNSVITEGKIFYKLGSFVNSIFYMKACKDENHSKYTVSNGYKDR